MFVGLHVLCGLSYVQYFQAVSSLYMDLSFVVYTTLNMYHVYELHRGMIT